MLKPLLSSLGVASVALMLPGPASAHDASQLRYELREQGYTQLQFIVDEAPFQVNACRDGERYHLHVDWYGRISERARIGECGREWSAQPWRRSYRSYDR